MLEGKPSADIRDMPEPAVLHIPLFSRRFNFDDVRVDDGEQVVEGQVLATDTANVSVPLLASRAGTVNLKASARHVTIDGPQPCSDVAVSDSGEGTAALVRLGAWTYLADAATGDVPDPAVSPAAIVISTLHLDPFLVRGDVQLSGMLEEFAKGLDLLRSISGNASFHMVIPQVSSDLAARVKDLAGRHGSISTVEVVLKYPYDSCKLAAKQLGLGGNGPVWALGVEGVLAVARALGEHKPCVSRVIAIGGPAAAEAVHARVVPGYPVEAIREACVAGGPVRVVNGGALSGAIISTGQHGIDVECLGLTMIPENTEREFLAFAQPGFGKHAFTRTFAGALRPLFRERYSTAVRGEHRPCVQCGSCSRACAASLTPFLMAHFADKKRLDDAARIGIKDCLSCGLCSFVCLSKRENSKTIFDALNKVRQEEKALAEQP